MTEAFKLKMRSLTFPILQILDEHLDIIEIQLKELKEKTPHLFQSSPVILDLHTTSHHDLSTLSAILRRYDIIPVGIQAGNPFYEQEAKKFGIPVFSAGKQENYQKTLTTLGSEPVLPLVSMKSSKLITKPVRSGQQVYAKDGDLIILSSVSPGAELLADGNIHVYGTLQGRALAGIQGNCEARIFCQSLEADLLSIAGFYMVSEVIDRYRRKGFQQVYLENNKLQIETL